VNGFFGSANHAALNGALNALSAVLIFAGFVCIKVKRREAHRFFMLSATGVSAIFLVSYLLRFAFSGPHNYPGHGTWKLIYFAILISHMLLALVTPFLVLRAIYLATRNRLPEHRAIVRWTLPVWMYVSVTGVLVYLLLYHPPG
jgi:putative membrane protein